jgi:hypothetical protein
VQSQRLYLLYRNGEAMVEEEEEEEEGLLLLISLSVGPSA